MDYSYKIYDIDQCRYITEGEILQNGSQRRQWQNHSGARYIMEEAPLRRISYLVIHKFKLVMDLGDDRDDKDD